MTITIRKANLADSKTIAQLGKTTFDETFQNVFPIRPELDAYLEKTFSVDKIKSSLSKPNNVFWLAFADDLPIGYAKFKRDSWYNIGNTEGVSQLQKIYVLKDYLDEKAGIKLLEVVENQWFNSNSTELWLVVLDSNLRAIRFYEKAGFQKVKKHYHTIGSQRFEFDLMAKFKAQILTTKP